MLTLAVMGLSMMAAFVLLVVVISGESRKRQGRAAATSDGTAYMSDGGADCDSGADGGCSDGGGDGGGGGGD